jgi:hypothetical protein
VSIEERLAAVEARLRTAEDTLEIMRLVNSYGPLADSGSSHEAASLWTEDGVYDVGGSDTTTPHRTVGYDKLKAIYDSPAHQELIHIGSAHAVGPLSVSVDGDRAEAVGFSQVFKKDGESWMVWRAAINHFALVRTEDGWRIETRTNRVLNGSDASHQIMRKVIR